METALALLAAVVYLFALAAPLAGLARERTTPGAGAQALREVRGGALAAVFAAAVLHAGALGAAFGDDGTFRFGFATAVSGMLLLATLFFALEAARSPIGAIRLVLYPCAALAVVLPLAFPAPASMLGGPALGAHIVLALVSYGLFALAALHATGMAFIDQALHQRHLQPPGGRRTWASVLLDLAPPLLVMEQLLFRAITVGFVLLTATLVTGIGFHEKLFGSPLRLDHKTVFSIISWLIFGVLLFGRARYGWRGRLALRYVFAGFTTLLLAYIGTHFVFEVLLGRR